FSRIGGKQAAVSHNFYDHTSVLKMIEWRWGLDPMTQRDASNSPSDPGNLATLLNFTHPVTKIPKLPNLPAFTPTACAASPTTTTEPPGINPADATGGAHVGLALETTGTTGTTWARLAASPLADGWTSGWT
ncbi:MAG TPA: hypothetical protein VG298_08065, partial [Acidimicrobiales bacterium]|nr:hypothetical protein [Acidimicrobiales bacterium]